MNATRLAGLALIIAGVLGLAYGSFTYTDKTHETTIGPLELSLSEKETVNIPIWLGAAAVIGGALLLVFRAKS